MKIKTKSNATFIDLFSGCGGFSAGLEAAGWTCLAGIDHNPKAIDTFSENHSKDTVSLAKDLTEFNPEDLAELIKVKHVDLIVGGPPCQGFSSARQSAGSNSGHRLVIDLRRELYKIFLKYINFFRPKIFVMENVLGIKKNQNGKYFTAIQNEARNIGYRVISFEVKTWEYGVPQKRVRQLFIGTLIDLPIFIPDEMIKKTHSLESGCKKLLPFVSLGEAIMDLPELGAGDERVIQDYDLGLRNKYLQKYSGSFLYDILNIANSNKLTWHCSRPHSERDLRDFSRLLEGETCSRALKRGVEMEFPYDKSTFKDRYTRQSRDGLCSTIVAHLKADGLMFIHPTQVRSLTPREAARIQTFPDTYKFVGSRSHVFTQIGNAVPPLVGKALGKGALSYLSSLKHHISLPKLLNTEKTKLVLKLEMLVNKHQIESIENTSDSEFKRIWELVRRLLPHLHPESIKDNGVEITMIPSREVSFCFEPYFIRSGWPVELTPIAVEANNRYKSGRISSKEYFHN